MTAGSGPRYAVSNRQWIGLALGPVLAALVYVLLPETYTVSAGEPVALGHAGRATAALAAWMAVWWLTEAIPIYATALLPLAALPLLGVTSMRDAAAPYAHELIFLFLGGFVLALALERWGLHRRTALFVLRFAGTRPSRIVGAFMLVTASLSMWVSNTASAMIMLPIATSVVALLEGEAAEEATTSTGDLSLALFLGIAYAASIGGMGTLIGTPPNLFLASFASDSLGRDIGFARWLLVGIPLVAVLLPLCWLLLVRVLYPVADTAVEGADRAVRNAYDALGDIGRGERVTAVVFTCTAAAWILRPLLNAIQLGSTRPLAGLSDAGVAILAALALFVIPVDTRARTFVMDWAHAVRLPWGILLLFGGGLSLASAIQGSGVSAYLGAQVMALAGIPTVLLVLFVTAGMVFLTELTSNTATAATLLPVLAALAPGLGVDPMLLAVPAAIAASAAFMLPVATPPNAIVFGSGRIPIDQMIRAGLWLNLIGIAVITMLALTAVRWWLL